VSAEVEDAELDGAGGPRTGVLSVLATDVGQRVAALPVWGQVLLLYVLTRLFTAVLTLEVARWQHASVWTPESPGYGVFTADLWDSTWYRSIAEHGYPLPLPRDASGVAQQSEWAFYPAYPLLVRALMALTSGSWEVVAPTTSLVLGAGAALVLHRLFATVAGPRAAVGGVALVLVFPASPVLQYAYTESLALLALSWALLTLVRRRYAWCAVAVLLLGASRAVALPFALVVAVHGLARWRAARTSGSAFAARERVEVVALTVLTALAGVAWPLVVGVATGDRSAYTEVQSAWRGGSVTWLVPWVVTSQRLLGTAAGPVVLAGALAALVWWCTSRPARALGPELPAWVLAQTAYLLAVLDPWTSTFRYWLLQVPLALLVAAAVRSRAHLLTWVGASLVLQVVWVAWLWRFTPPSDFPP
jgi:hypothetical protein